MSQDPNLPRELYECLKTSHKMYEAFINDFGREPTEVEHAIAVTLFIQQNRPKKGAGGGGRPWAGGGGGGGGGGGQRQGGGFAPTQIDSSVPVLRRKPPRGKNQNETWGSLIETTPDYVEWAVANTDWFTPEDKSVVSNALQQGMANGSSTARDDGDYPF